MDSLTVFGVAAVSAMLLFYALEDRARHFVLLFAGACLASSVYGFVQGAWPFGVVEAVWTVVAVQRWRQRIPAQTVETGPIACDMSALSIAERHQYDALRAKVTESIIGVTETATEFELLIGRSVAVTDAAQWVSLEHRCCPFLNMWLAPGPDGTTRLRIGGSKTIKAFVADEFQRALSNRRASSATI